MPKGFTIPIVPAVILVLILVVGGVFYFNRSNISQVLPPTPSVTITPTSTTTLHPVAGSERVSWDVSVGSIPQVEEQKLRLAVATVKIPTTIPQDTYLSITNVSILGNWAILSGGERVRTPQPVQPTGVFEFLAHKIGTDWKITTPDDSDFCRVLKMAPDMLISKNYYSGCGSQ